jgi:hypothetical protein
MRAQVPTPLSAGPIRLGLLCLLVLTACDAGQLGPEGLCVGAVNVNGIFYRAASIYLPASADVSSEPYLIVSRNTGCLDQGEPADPLAHGESNFLAAGTKLHIQTGYEPAERLVHWSPIISEWIVLMPWPASP